MSSEPEFDLELHFLPAWAQEPSANRYAKYDGADATARPAGRQRDQRPERPRRRPDSPARGPGEPRRHGGFERRPARPGDERRAPVPVLPQVNVSFLPDEKGVDSLARQIRLTGRAYPLFGIAQMILKKPERHQVTFSAVKKPDGAPAQPLFHCALDDTLWLSEADAMQHVFQRHFDLFYKIEKIPTEPPKGTYTFVAQCGMSGVILGPPNYHDYQNKLVKLHAERFSRMPFEAFKSRVKIVRDEAVVKQWIEQQSFKLEYDCLNIPETKRLARIEEVEAHFRETHLPNVIKPVEAHTAPGLAARQMPEPSLRALVRRALEDQSRFPLKVATVLSQQFATRGLQFFKVNRTVTHVAVARPHYLDLNATPVSDGVKRIVEFINRTPHCTRRKLLEGLAPGAAGAIPETPPEGAPVAEIPPEINAINGDLHWLIHQGHVIEFAHGILETAKPPVLKPAKAPAEANESGSPELASPEPASPEPPASVPAPAPDTEAPLEENAAAPPDAGSELEQPQPPPAPAAEAAGPSAATPEEPDHEGKLPSNSISTPST